MNTAITERLDAETLIDWYMDDILYMKSAVSLGATLLDVKRPGWEHTVQDSITEGYFNMTTWDSCICGSLELIRYSGSYGYDGHGNTIMYEQNMIVFNGTKIIADVDGHKYGFLPPGDNANDRLWDILDAMWRVEVNKRLGS